MISVVPLGSAMAGVLSDGYVVVKEQKEGTQLYNKGNFGYPRSGGGVDLDIVEAAFLCEWKRLEVQKDGRAMTFDELFGYAGSVLEGFDIIYMVYRDLRQRGFVVKIESGTYDMSVFPRGMTMSNSRPLYMVKAVSERTAIEISEFIGEAGDVRERQKQLLYGVVDEEGDVTYYNMFMRDPVGKVFPSRPDRVPEGVLARDRVFVFGQEDAEALRSEGFFGQLMGSTLQLSLIECCHLLGKGRMTLRAEDGSRMGFEELREHAAASQDEFDNRLAVYSDLRERGLVVKTGFKYGTHFRVYEGSPDDCHARYLAHAVSDRDLRMWPEISRTVRLSGGVKKEILYGRVHRGAVEYLEFKWFRPRSHLLYCDHAHLLAGDAVQSVLRQLLGAGVGVDRVQVLQPPEHDVVRGLPPDERDALVHERLGHGRPELLHLHRPLHHLRMPLCEHHEHPDPEFTCILQDAVGQGHRMGAAADDPLADEEREVGPSAPFAELHQHGQLYVAGVHRALAVGGLVQAGGALAVGRMADDESVEVYVLRFHD